MFEKIIKIISEYQGFDKIAITPETYLVADLGLNSYDVITLVTRFEDEFHVEIPDRDIKRLQTVDDISKYLAELV